MMLDEKSAYPDVPRFTGRSLVAVHLDRPPEYIRTFVEHLSPLLAEAGERTEWAIYDSIGAAVIPHSPETLLSLQAEHPDALAGVSIGPERILYPQPVAHAPAATAAISPLDAMRVTYQHRGRVKVMVLDSGINDKHPDFNGRYLELLQFNGSGTDDPLGHGTHCTGLACGPLMPYDGGPRYGVATESKIVHGKTLSATGQFDDGAILAGIKWATNPSREVVVINISIACPVLFNEPFSEPFELVAVRALDAGVLLVAAAGNDPRGIQWPVQHPANCPSVMAVAALDGNLDPSETSCVGVNPGQYVDVAAPSYRIRSCDLHKGYSSRTGTSVASAFVAGIAALWADTPAALRGRSLWYAITRSAIPVSNGTFAKVGAGLVQAPPP